MVNAVVASLADLTPLRLAGVLAGAYAALVSAHDRAVNGARGGAAGAVVTRERGGRNTVVRPPTTCLSPLSLGRTRAPRPLSPLLQNQQIVWQICFVGERIKYR